MSLQTTRTKTTNMNKHSKIIDNALQEKEKAKKRTHSEASQCGFHTVSVTPDSLTMIPHSLQTVIFSYSTYSEQALSMRLSKSVTPNVKQARRLQHTLTVPAMSNVQTYLEAHIRSAGNANRLEYLNIDSSELNDGDLKFICENFPNLTTLNVLHGEKLTNIGVTHLTPLKNLELISLTSCTQINDAGLQYLSAHTKLRSLTLTECGNVSDGGITLLVSQLKQLHELNINEASGITREGEKQLFHMERKFQITIKRNGILTEECLEASMLNFSKLKNINVLKLNDCYQMTDAAIAYLANMLKYNRINSAS